MEQLTEEQIKELQKDNERLQSLLASVNGEKLDKELNKRIAKKEKDKKENG